jgi:hypothetical protein
MEFRLGSFIKNMQDGFVRDLAGEFDQGLANVGRSIEDNTGLRIHSAGKALRDPNTYHEFRGLWNKSTQVDPNDNSMAAWTLSIAAPIVNKTFAYGSWFLVDKPQEILELGSIFTGLYEFKTHYFSSVSLGYEEAQKTNTEGSYLFLTLVDWQVFAFTMLAPCAKGSVGGSRLVHLTTEEAGAGIEASGGKLIGNNYVGPLSNANSSGLGVTLRTGMSPGSYQVAVPIPAQAAGAFSKPIPIGPISLWQRMTGQQFTANGVLNLQTGQFSRLGVNWNQVGVYGLDAVIDALIAGNVYSDARK